MSSILQTKNLGVQFGGLRALQGVDLEIHDGELVGLIGPNGAGKTTFFNLITGIYTPTQGEVFISGKKTNGMSPIRVTNECRCARTFQNIRLFRDLSVLENVLVASHKKISYGFSSVILSTKKFRKGEADLRTQATDLLKIFSLDAKADELAKNLPYGEQRKLEIVRALATNPKLLFLDEPAAGMNNNETAQLLDLIRLVREKFSLAILVIEHDMKFIMGLCERIYVLDHGQLIAEGNPKEIQSNPEVIKAYLGEEAA